MNNNPVIRQAEVTDSAKVSRLLRSAMLTYCTDSGIPESMLEAMTESVGSVADRISKQTCLIAELDGEIVGTVCLKLCPNPLVYSFSDKTCEYLKEAGPSCYISRFAVLEQFRRTGLGIDLISKAIEIAEGSGCKCALLHSAASNKKMVEFYGKRGFELIDSEGSRGYLRGLFANRLDRL